MPTTILWLLAIVPTYVALMSALGRLLKHRFRTIPTAAPTIIAQATQYDRQVIRN